MLCSFSEIDFPIFLVKTKKKSVSVDAFLGFEEKRTLLVKYGVSNFGQIDPNLEFLRIVFKTI